MKAPHGCPVRRVDMITPRPGGAFLKLSCGHSNWEAGFNAHEQENVMQFGVGRPCLQAPCYQRQRAFAE